MNRRALLAGMCGLAVPCVGSVPRKSLVTENVLPTSVHWHDWKPILQGVEFRPCLHPTLTIRARFSPSVVKLEGCNLPKP